MECFEKLTDEKKLYFLNLFNYISNKEKQETFYVDFS